MSFTKRSFNTPALVLKRTNIGESDRIVTLLTPNQGKVVCVAKGVRKLTSSQSAALEPGNHVSVFLIQTHSLPLVTQTKLLNDFTETKKTLRGMKKLMQVLEVVDKLFPEGVEEVELFETVLNIVKQLNQSQKSFEHIQDQLTNILVQLGYQDPHETTYKSVLDYVAALADRPMRSYEYLTVKK